MEGMVDIAVIGASRQGKSSLINNIFGSNVTKTGALRVTTEDIQPYTIRNTSTQVRLWDVPGIDAKNFRREVYFQKIQPQEVVYDYCILVTKDTYSGDLDFLVTNLEKKRIPFCIVRTHVDRSVEDSLNEGECDNEDACLNLIVQDLEEGTCKLERLPPLFLLSNRHKEKFQMPSFLTRLVALYDILAVRKTYFDAIEPTYHKMRGRIPATSTWSGTLGSVPLPFLRSGVESGYVPQELRLYQKQFKLTDAAITELETKLGEPKGHLKAIADRELSRSFQGFAPFRNRCTNSVDDGFVGRELGGQVVKMALPVVGSFIMYDRFKNKTERELNFYLDLSKSLASDLLYFGV